MKKYSVKGGGAILNDVLNFTQAIIVLIDGNEIFDSFPN